MAEVHWPTPLSNCSQQGAKKAVLMGPISKKAHAFSKEPALLSRINGGQQALHTR